MLINYKNYFLDSESSFTNLCDEIVGENFLFQEDDEEKSGSLNSSEGFKLLNKNSAPIVKLQEIC